MNAIIYSVWKCRGNWYTKTWGLHDGNVLDIAPHYRGVKRQDVAMDMARAYVDLVRRKYPETESFPAVMEGSVEHRDLLASIQSPMEVHQ